MFELLDQEDFGCEKMFDEGVKFNENWNDGKHQTMDPFSPLTPNQEENALYFLYVDHFENLNLSEEEAPKTHVDGKGGFLTSAKLDYETGKYSKERLFDFRNVKGMEVFQFATHRIVHLAENEIAIEFYKKKKEDVWIRVGLK